MLEFLDISEDKAVVQMGGGDKPDHVDTYSSSIGALFLF